MDSYIKETGKKGFITYKYKDRYIYSKYDPVNEACKFFSSFILKEGLKPNLITCCGADYINNEILKNNVNLVISFEPIEFEKTVNSSKLYRVKSISEIERVLLNNNIHAKDLGIIIWQPLVETNPDIYLKPLHELKEIIYKSSISSNTQKAFGFVENMNALINFLTLDKIKLIKKNDAITGNPALVISSGASLINSIDFIKCIKSRVYIFALPSAVPFLNYAEIIPDFIIAVDPGYGTFYHLAKNLYNTTLIAPLSITPSILRINSLNTLHFSYNTYFEKNIFKSRDNIVSVNPEGSVIMNLLRILPQLGFSNAILTGQDFGFYNNRSHIKGGFFEKEFFYMSGYFSPVEDIIKKTEEELNKTEINIDGNKIITTESLKIYYNHFIKQDFKLNLFVPGNCFNPISDNVKKIEAEYIINKYKEKSGISILKDIVFENINHRISIKKQIKKLYKEIINSNLSKDSKNIIEEIFIDIKNELHLLKIKKISGV